MGRGRGAERPGDGESDCTAGVRGCRADATVDGGYAAGLELADGRRLNPTTSTSNFTTSDQGRKRRRCDKILDVYDEYRSTENRERGIENGQKGFLKASAGTGRGNAGARLPEGSPDGPSGSLAVRADCVCGAEFLAERQHRPAD